MSDHRRKRMETLQGLHQFLMHLYIDYSKTTSEQEARDLIVDVLKSEFEFFAGTLTMDTAKPALKERAALLNKMLDKADDYDQKIYIAEKIDALERAVEILDEPV